MVVLLSAVRRRVRFEPGQVARYGIGLVVGPRAFPYATLAINLAGLFLFGLILVIGAEGRLSPRSATALAVGFLGAFTTYSTFAREAFTLGRTDRLALAALYIGLSVTLGLLAAAGGYHVGKAVAG